jgi:hypothetical protein
MRHLFLYPILILTGFVTACDSDSRTPSTADSTSVESDTGRTEFGEDTQDEVPAEPRFDPNWSLRNAVIGKIPTTASDTDKKCKYSVNFTLWVPGSSSSILEAFPGQFVLLNLDCIANADDLIVLLDNEPIEVTAITATTLVFQIPAETLPGETVISIVEEYESTRPIVILEAMNVVEDPEGFVLEALDAVEASVEALPESVSRQYAMKALADARAELPNLTTAQRNDLAAMLVANPFLLGGEPNAVCDIYGNKIDERSECFWRVVVTNIKAGLAAAGIAVIGISSLATPAAPAGIIAAGIAIAVIAKSLMNIVDDAMGMLGSVVAVMFDDGLEVTLDKATLVQSGVPFKLTASANFVNFAGMTEEYLDTAAKTNTAPKTLEVVSLFGKLRDFASIVSFAALEFPLDPMDAEPKEELHDIPGENLEVSGGSDDLAGIGRLEKLRCPGYEDRWNIIVPEPGSYPVDLEIRYEGFFSSAVATVEFVVQGGSSSATWFTGIWEETITENSQLVSKCRLSFGGGTGQSVNSVSCLNYNVGEDEEPEWYTSEGSSGYWEVAALPGASGPGVFCHIGGFLRPDVIYNYSGGNPTFLTGSPIAGSNNFVPGRVHTLKKL